MKTKSKINIAIGALVFLIISLNSSHAKEQTARMDCDSTCIVPSGMLNLIPKAHTFTATPTVPAPKPTCGPSGGSILPAAPSTFLCSSGNPSLVSSTTNDGETTYKWTCSNTTGAASCMAYKREPGVCGASNGTTISSTPGKLCASGDPSNLKLNGNQYSWFCTGNYGPKSSCTAQLNTPPEEPAEQPTLAIYGHCGPAINSCALGIFVDVADNAYNHVWVCQGYNEKGQPHGNYSESCSVGK